MSAPPGIDPVNAIAVALTVFLSPAVAYVLGAYSVIFIAALVGAGWALLRREQHGLAGAFFFVILLTLTSTLVTVGIAHGVNTWLGLESVNVLLAPISLLVSAVGHNWKDVIPFLVEKAFDLVAPGVGFARPRRRQADRDEEDEDPTPTPNRKF